MLTPPEDGTGASAYRCVYEAMHEAVEAAELQKRYMTDPQFHRELTQLAVVIGGTAHHLSEHHVPTPVIKAAVRDQFDEHIKMTLQVEAIFERMEEEFRTGARRPGPILVLPTQESPC